jgi:superfamily II DNA/RNA helicase
VPPTFADLGVPDDLASVLSERGIVDPFPIQAATIPAALAGRDVCGRAPTGSGKTIAFGVPLIAGLRGAAPRSPEALVLVPTRELCAQVAEELAPLAALRGASVVAVYGGVSDRPQRRALSSNAGVVVACPGRLEDLLQQRALRLDAVRHVVIDEADRMADMGFLPAVQRILDATSSDRQTQLFSATLGGPVAKLTRRYQHEPVRHEIEAAADAPTPHDHEFRTVDRASRAAVTAELVRSTGSTVVFCRTRHGVSRLTKQLSRSGVQAAELHGGRSQSQRDRALAAFASGRIQALVATDVAARGLHVDDIACVVHYDLPGDADTYIHRSGRTARAGASGSVVALVDETATADAAALRKALGLDAPARSKPRQRDTVKPKARREREAVKSPQRRQPAPHGRRGLGRVKSFDARKGFGFIARDRGTDVFVHYSNIAGDGFKKLDKGQHVEFVVAPGRKGDEALEVRAV